MRARVTLLTLLKPCGKRIEGDIACRKLLTAEVRPCNNNPNRMNSLYMLVRVRISNHLCNSKSATTPGPANCVQVGQVV